ncbi:MAG TPA: hypothetical protein VGP62_12070 [Bryobacteraceae bacterium]|jgi:uncharacterized protein (TIGR03437 family)|nr:hypothetical protein [Bryobacteraceae bacterium]
MLILAAALLFAPHYEITLPRFLFAATASLPVSDAKGNLYFISDEIGPSGSQPQRVTRIDPDGKVVYRVIPVVNGTFCQSSPLTPDSAENLYVASTCSVGGVGEIVVSKIGPSGTILYTFPTQISSTVSVNGMTVGPDGSVFLTGSALPNYLATTQGAYVSSLQAAPHPNAFVVEVNAAGTAIKYATFLDNAPPTQSPGEVQASGVAIAIDSNGEAYVTGTTDDIGFPTSEGAFNRNCDCSIGYPVAFVVRLNVDGSNVDYSTFLVPHTLPGNPPLPPPSSISVNSGFQATVTEVLGGGSQFSTTRLDQYGTQLLSYNLVTFQVQGFFSVTPDGLGNLLFSGQNAPTNLPISAGAFSNGTAFVAEVRIEDGSVLYATHLPAGSASGGILPDGSGGFLVIGAAVGGPIPSTQFTRLAPVSSSTPAVLGVANVAGLAVSPGLAPGEVASIYGTGLGPSPGLQGKFDSNGRLPESLGGTEVYFNGVRAPLLYSGDQQVNAIVPFSVSGRTVSVVLIVNGKVSNQAYLPTQTADPEIFKANIASAADVAFAVNEDGSVNSAQNPAKGGSVLTLFVSGAGLLSPTPEDGTRGGLGPRLVLPVTVNVSYAVSLQEGVPAPIYAQGEVRYAGSAPTLAAGVVQIDVQLPVEAYVGSSQSVLIYFGDVSGPLGASASQGSVWIASTMQNQ